MTWIRVAATAGFLAVAFGAFGAHGLKHRIPEALMAPYQTGAAYHLVHAVALLALALYGKASDRSVALPAGLFLAGIVLFSGSLYLLAILQKPAFGAVTPIGGLLLLAAWVAVAFTAS